MTLIELMIAAIVLALLTSVALPSYRSYVDRARVSRAIADMKQIEMNVERFVTRNGNHPASLADMGTVPTDPWGNAYRYLRMEGASVGQVRKDHAQHPLNTDYDLYSMGPDGQSTSPLTAAKSRDDIVRARNGSFLGKASDY